MKPVGDGALFKTMTLHIQKPMSLNESFMPLPNALADALIRLRLSGSQWRLIFWTLRNTLGWNRESTKFTWYQIAKELGIDRAGLLRAARPLLDRGLLVAENGRLRVQISTSQVPKPMTLVTGDAQQRNRCQVSPLFPRAIDMYNVVKTKEKNKTKKEKWPDSHPAGAARPIPGKYDRISES